jgi:hypothetical protein
MNAKYQVVFFTQSDFGQQVHDNFVKLGQADDDVKYVLDYYRKSYDLYVKHGLQIDYAEYVKFAMFWDTYVFDMQIDSMDDNFKQEIEINGYYRIFNNVFNKNYTREEYDNIQNWLTDNCELFE